MYSSLILIACLASAAAADWPQWRGPNRDGLSGVTVPAKWPDQLKLIWKIEVGEGHSSPILAGGRIFQFSRLNDRETLQAIDPRTGTTVWNQSYAAPYTVTSAAQSHGKGPKSTPVYADGRVFTFGIGGILSCFKASDGAVVWRKDFKQSPDYGVAMSPVVWNGLLIAHTGNPDGGALTGFDAATGAVKWRWTGDGPAYASPVVAVFDSMPQVITQSRKHLIAVDPRGGQLLWSVPFHTNFDQNAVTPIVIGGLVIYSGESSGITALRPIHKGSAWTTETMWHSDDASFYMNTPVAVGGTLFGFSHKNKGQFVALDPANGKVKWRGNGRQGENAAIVAAGDVLFLLTNNSDLTVQSLSGMQPLKRYTVADSETWANPLLLDSGIVVKDAGTLRLLSWNLR